MEDLVLIWRRKRRIVGREGQGLRGRYLRSILEHCMLAVGVRRSSADDSQAHHSQAVPHSKDRVLVASPHTFDPSAGDVFACLTLGAVLCLAPRGSTPLNVPNPNRGQHVPRGLRAHPKHVKPEPSGTNPHPRNYTPSTKNPIPEIKNPKHQTSTPQPSTHTPIFQPST